MPPLVLFIRAEEQLMAWHLGSQLDAGQKSSAQLAVQRVGLLGWWRQAMLQHDSAQLTHLLQQTLAEFMNASSNSAFLQLVFPLTEHIDVC